MAYQTSNPYQDPSAAAWLDSAEGVPDWHLIAVESPAERAARGRGRTWLNTQFDAMGALLPGFGLALLLALIGQTLSVRLNDGFLHYKESPISPILLAIVLGLLVRNVVGLPSIYEKGLKFCVRFVLRVGIALLGLKLSLIAIGKIGMVGVPVVLACIAAALLLVTWISRAVGLPRRLGSLIAVGTSICGVSAIVATAPVIGADDDETSYAVACITLFGLLALFVYPFLAPLLFGAGELQQIGTFLGTAIHDTSQVAGAALMFDQQQGIDTNAAESALGAATVTKLFRNVCMAAVIPLMAFLYHRGEAGGAKKGVQKWHQVVPLFVIGFVLAAALSSLADWTEKKPFGLIDRITWDILKDNALWLVGYCLAIAMAAVGLGTSLARLRKLGLRPLLVGFAAAVLVGAVSFGMIKLIA